MKKAEVKKGKKKNALKEYWPLYLMMLPALLYLLINNYIPMAGMVIAFKKLNFAKGIWASPWAGLKNFKFLFASRDAWVITRNTLLYNVAFILVNMVIGIAIAILITEVKKHKAQKAISERDSSSVSDVHGYLKLHRICASECGKWSCQQLHPSVVPHGSDSVVPETEILAGGPDHRELLEGRRIRMPDLYRIPDRY